MKRISQKRLAEIIRDRRNRMDMTQETLSELTGINRTMIGRIERSDYLPTITQLESLLNVLEFNYDAILVADEPTFCTAFRGSNITEQDNDDIEQLLLMMSTAKQQLLLRKAFLNDKSNEND